MSNFFHADIQTVAKSRFVWERNLVLGSRRINSTWMGRMRSTTELGLTKSCAFLMVLTSLQLYPSIRGGLGMQTSLRIVEDTAICLSQLTYENAIVLLSNITWSMGGSETRCLPIDRGRVGSPVYLPLMIHDSCRKHPERDVSRNLAVFPQGTTTPCFGSNVFCLEDQYRRSQPSCFLESVT